MTAPTPEGGNGRQVAVIDCRRHVVVQAESQQDERTGDSRENHRAYRHRARPDDDDQGRIVDLSRALTEQNKRADSDHCCDGQVEYAPMTYQGPGHCNGRHHQAEEHSRDLYRMFVDLGPQPAEQNYDGQPDTEKQRQQKHPIDLAETRGTAVEIETYESRDRRHTLADLAQQLLIDAQQQSHRATTDARNNVGGTHRKATPDLSKYACHHRIDGTSAA